MLRLFVSCLCAMLLVPFAAPVSAQQIVFKDVTKEAGLYEPLAGMMGHGGAWGDVDGDGLPDLFVGGFCDRPNEEYAPAKGPVPNRLMRNLGNGRFERMPQPAVEYFGRTSGAIFADLDNNGTLELYGANNAKPKAATDKVPQPQRDSRVKFSSLFRNDAGKLVDISTASGACQIDLETARNIGVFDYNGDGLLDLLVLEDIFTKGPRSILFKNLGGLKFKDVNAEVGLPDDIYGLGLAVADLNNDGQADFFVGHSNRLFLSDKSGKYTEPAELKELFGNSPSAPRDREEWPCGAHFTDLNLDGTLDMVLSLHYEKARNRVFINDGLKRGVPQFRDVTSQVGLPDEIPNKSPHVEIQDFNNDGLPDIYFSTAWKDSAGNITPLVYRNTGIKNGLPHFVAPRPFKEGETIVYYPAGPTADYDGDGRLDIFLINWFQENWSRLLHNESDTNHWLDVTVAGKTFNRQGIGSQIRVYQAGKLGKADALLGFQELTTGYGYASGQPAGCHFGLGSHEKVDLAIRLPNGKQLKLTDVSANQKLNVAE